MSKNSFILHTDSLSILDKLSDAQAGQLFKAIYCFVQNPSEKITFNDKLIKHSFLKIRDEIFRGWETSYVKNGKIKYHWNWKGGITSENHEIRQSNKYKNWRNSVFERDEYQCQYCGQKGGILHAHHIKHFATHKDLRFDIDNGLTLCKSCHNNEHSKKGGQND